MSHSLYRSITCLVLMCSIIITNAIKEKVKNGNLMMTRILFFIVFFLTQYVSAYPDTVIRIQMVNGDKYEIPFPDEPEMAFQDTKLNINGLKNSLVLTRSQIDNIKFVNAETGIKNTPEDKVEVKMVWTSPRHLTVYGQRLSPLHLYSLNGVEVNLPYQESPNSIDANFDGLPEGIYILNIGKAKTIKINIKK